MAATSVVASSGGSGGGGGVSLGRINYEWDKRVSKHMSCIEQVVWHRETIQAMGVALEVNSGDDPLSAEAKHAQALASTVASLKQIECDLRLQKSVLTKAQRLIDASLSGEEAAVAAVAALPLAADGNTRDWPRILSQLTDAARTADYETETKREIAQTVSQYKRSVHDVNHKGEAVPGEEHDDELAVVGSDEAEIKTCPVTLEPITLAADPRINPSCGHIYSAAGINSYLDAQTRIAPASKRDTMEVACPLAGCGKKVSRKRLEMAVAYIHRLKKRKTPPAGAAASAGSGGGAATRGGGGDEKGDVDFTQASSATAVGSDGGAAAAAAGDGDEVAEDISQTQRAASKRRKPNAAASAANAAQIKVKREKKAAEAAAAAASAAAAAAGDADDPVSSATPPKH